MLLRYILFGALGVAGEVAFTALVISAALLFMSKEKQHNIGYGYSYIWMFFIYGLGAVMYPYVLQHVGNWHWFGRGLSYMGIIFVVEYLTGYWLKKVLGHCPWDYHGKATNISGLIRLDYSPIWFGVGLLGEVVYKYMGAHGI